MTTATAVAVATLALTGSAKWIIFGLVIAALVAVGWAGMRWESTEHMDTLSGIPVFGALSRRQLRSLARTARPIEFPPGAVVTREGDKGNSLFVIDEGTAVVTAGGERKAMIGAHSSVGEVAVIDGGPRTATIAAETLLRVVEVTGGSLSRLLESDPGFCRAVYLGLQGVVRGAGGSAPDAPMGVDRSNLVDLCAELRRIQTPDWAEPAPGRKRRGLLARKR